MFAPCKYTDASSRIQHQPTQQPGSQIIREKGPRDPPPSPSGAQLAMEAPRAHRVDTVLCILVTNILSQRQLPHDMSFSKLPLTAL
eukprot:363973-Chlamydomonas_euryale.AAC.20